MERTCFLFLLTLPVAASWLITSKNLVLSRLTRTILFMEEFLWSTRTPPWCFWRAIEDCFFFYPCQKTIQWSASLILLMKWNIIWISYQIILFRVVEVNQHPLSTFVLIVGVHNLEQKGRCILYHKSLHLLFGLEEECFVQLCWHLLFLWCKCFLNQ